MSFYTLLTAIGAADFINAQAGGTTVPFTHLALGDGGGAAVTPLESMTALVHEVHRVPISSVTARLSAMAREPSRRPPPADAAQA